MSTPRTLAAELIDCSTIRDQTQTPTLSAARHRCHHLRSYHNVTPSSAALKGRIKTSTNPAVAQYTTCLPDVSVPAIRLPFSAEDRGRGGEKEAKGAQNNSMQDSSSPSSSLRRVVGGNEEDDRRRLNHRQAASSGVGGAGGILRNNSSSSTPHVERLRINLPDVTTTYNNEEWRCAARAVGWLDRQQQQQRYPSEVPTIRDVP